MSVECIAIRQNEIEHGPHKGTSPVIVFVEQNMTGAGMLPVGSPVEINQSLDEVSFKSPENPFANKAPILPHQINDVYFVVDCSDSMGEITGNGITVDKLSHSRNILNTFASHALPKDTKAHIISFNTKTSEVYTSSSSLEHARIPQMMLSLEPGGDTDFTSPFAFIKNSIAERAKELGQPPRSVVIFGTDGLNHGDATFTQLLSRELRQLNAATYLIGIGANYSQANIFELSSYFGYSGWAHTPVRNGIDAFDKVIPALMNDVSASDHYLTVNFSGTGACPESRAQIDS